MLTLVSVRDTFQLVATEPAWMAPWWGTILVEFEKKNEFDLKLNGVPLDYKVDLPGTPTPEAPVYVFVFHAGGALRVNASLVPIPNASKIISRGIWAVSAQAPTPTPEPPDLTGIEASLRHLQEEIDQLKAAKTWKVALYSRSGAPLVVGGAAIVLALEDDLVDELLDLLGTQERRDKTL